MSEKINVQCYKCKTVYELDLEMRGQVVVCAVCNAVFSIPELQHKVEMITTNPYIDDSAKAAFDDDEFNLKTSNTLKEKLPSTETTKLPTETIKIKKTSRGMIPKVEDKFGVQEGHPLQHDDHNEDVLEKFKKTQVKSAKSVPKPAPQKSKWWPFSKKDK
jgi:hypothetical protein